ncbi:MAG: hypothetical protein Aurels2KO_57140 [Aureliella sp.]
MHEAKIAKLMDCMRPTTKKALHSFVGLGSYYRRFLKGFAQLARPLHRLIAESSDADDLVWNVECDQSFQGIKAAIKQNVVLAVPVVGIPFIVDTDASDYAIGGVLSQVIEGEERPIYFYSRVLTAAERNYSVTEKEGVGMISSIQHFRPYILGEHITIRTDHAPLCALMRKSDLTGRLARWQALLFEFPDCTWVTRSGVKHQNADALSRLQPAMLGCACGSESSTDVSTIQKKNEDMESVMGQAGTEEDLEILVEPVGTSQTGGVCLNVCDASGVVPDVVSGHVVGVLGGPVQGNANRQIRDNDLPAVRKTSEPQHPQVSNDSLAIVSGRMGITWTTPTWYQQVMEQMHLPEDQQVPEVKQFKLMFDVLLRCDPDGVYKMCIAPEHVHNTIAAAHNVGHFAAQSTLMKLREGCWWPQMYSDVHAFVRKCHSCQLHSPVPQKGSYQPMTTVQPWDVIQVDFTMGLPENSLNRQAIITAVDCFSGFIIAESTNDLTARTAAEFLLRRVILLFGVPGMVYTDNGSHFKGEFQDMLSAMHVKQKFSTAYYAEPHGRVERAHKLLLDRMRRFMTPDWPRHLDAAVFAANARMTEAYPFSPLEILCGIRPRGVFERQLVDIFERVGLQGDKEETEDFRRRLYRMGIVRDAHAAHAHKVSERWCKPRKIDVNIGDEVLVTTENRRKLEPKWKGPYVVTWVGAHGVIQANGRRYPRFRVKPYLRAT